MLKPHKALLYVLPSDSAPAKKVTWLYATLHEPDCLVGKQLAELVVVAPAQVCKLDRVDLVVVGILLCKTEGVFVLFALRFHRKL